MWGGRIYPEYTTNNSLVVVKSDSWKMAKVISETSGYIPEKMYPPAVPIIKRFNGELIAYTGQVENITAFDIELDKNHHIDNKKSTLKGIRSLIEFMLNKE